MIFSRFPLLPIPPSLHPLLRLLSTTGIGGRGIFATFELDCVAGSEDAVLNKPCFACAMV